MVIFSYFWLFYISSAIEISEYLLAARFRNTYLAGSLASVNFVTMFSENLD
jgi:hypothetical protein